MKPRTLVKVLGGGLMLTVFVSIALPQAASAEGLLCQRKNKPSYMKIRETRIQALRVVRPPAVGCPTGWDPLGIIQDPADIEKIAMRVFENNQASLQGEQGPTGPTGPQGAQGPQGMPGIVNADACYSKTESANGYGSLVKEVYCNDPAQEFMLNFGWTAAPEELLDDIVFWQARQLFTPGYTYPTGARARAVRQSFDHWTLSVVIVCCPKGPAT